jgi:hypothetical protein
VSLSSSGQPTLLYLVFDEGLFKPSIDGSFPP